MSNPMIDGARIVPQPKATRRVLPQPAVATQPGPGAIPPSYAVDGRIEALEARVAALEAAGGLEVQAKLPS
jgi:hypothetical protein